MINDQQQFAFNQTQEDREDILSRLDLPVGAATLWIGNLAEPPNGWLFANDMYYPIQKYRKLFDVLVQNPELVYNDREFQLPDLTQTINSMTVQVLIKAF